MPSYNTRLRTNSVLLPPRRLRHSPEPPPRPQPRPRAPATPDFPPPAVVLHPDDAANKTLVAIGRALLAVDNRAITIKDLSQLVLDCGLLCHNVSAASQAITTFIRNHLARCHSDRSPPLLLSLALTGSADDDRLAPALHSRSGGTSSSKGSTATITSFRRGTTVWYLSEQAGATCPFKRAGLCLDDILGGLNGTKRKRGPCHTSPRKLSTPGPAMSTRTRAHAAQPEAQPPACLRVKLTLRVPNPDPEPESESDSDSDSISDLSESDDDRDDRDDPSVYNSPPPSVSLPPYPILSPSIPSPACTTPATSFASPSAPCASFLPFRTALSNPPLDYRFRSHSLPFSSASPPPDSEDEDHDFHNSMVGMRRDSVPLKQEEDDSTDWSTPLQLLPSFHPSPVKAEPTSAVLPPPPEWDNAPRWDDRWTSDAPPWHIKNEHTSDDERTVLDPEDTPALGGKGTRDDPVRIDTTVGDVEVLGPESVRSREWDAAWAKDDTMDVDSAPPGAREPSPDLAPTAVSSPPAALAPLAPQVPIPAGAPPLRPFCSFSPAETHHLQKHPFHPLHPLLHADPRGCIRAEDVFAPRAFEEEDVPDVGEVRFPPVELELGGPAGEEGPGEDEGLFGAFVEFGEGGKEASAAVIAAVVAAAKESSVVTATASAHAKENVGAPERAPAAVAARRKRDKLVEQQPVRRSKRGQGAAKPAAPVTRSRSHARI